MEWFVAGRCVCCLDEHFNWSKSVWLPLPLRPYLPKIFGRCFYYNTFTYQTKVNIIFLYWHGKYPAVRRCAWACALRQRIRNQKHVKTIYPIDLSMEDLYSNEVEIFGQHGTACMMVSMVDVALPISADFRYTTFSIVQKYIDKLLTEVISMQDDDFKYIPTKKYLSHYRKQANETTGQGHAKREWWTKKKKIENVRA